MNTPSYDAEKLSQLALGASNIIMVCGVQWGDEGKWKAISAFQWKKIDYVVWANGWGNAGHTVFYNGQKLDFHELPGWAVLEWAKIYLSKGKVIQISLLGQEMQKLQSANISLQNKIIIWGWAQVVLTSFQQKIDADIEKLRWGDVVGTTMKWIGPSYAGEALRVGFTIKELLTMDDVKLQERIRVICWLFCSLDKEALQTEIYQEKQKLQNWISEWYVTIDYDDMGIHQAVKRWENILIEQSQSFLLGKEAGAYPYCTSSDTSVNGIKSYLNIPYNLTPFVIGTAKAIMSKVWGGYLPTKMWREASYKTFEQDFARQTWEIGVTTWRLRDLGWVDIPALRHTTSINPLDIILITKWDVLRILAEAQERAGLDQEMRFYTAFTNPETWGTVESWMVNNNAIGMYTSIPLWADDEKNIEWFGINIKKFLPEFSGSIFFWNGPKEHEIVQFM